MVRAINRQNLTVNSEIFIPASPWEYLSLEHVAPKDSALKWFGQEERSRASNIHKRLAMRQMMVIAPAATGCHLEPAVSQDTLTHGTHLPFPSLMPAQEEAAIITPVFSEELNMQLTWGGRGVMQVEEMIFKL